MSQIPIKVLEVEYAELESIELGKGKFKNIKFGLRISTTQENYETDLQRLIIEVKTKLNELASRVKPFQKTNNNFKGKGK